MFKRRTVVSFFLSSHRVWLRGVQLPSRPQVNDDMQMYRLSKNFQFFCPFVSRSLRSSDILVLVTINYPSMTTSIKGAPYYCIWKFTTYMANFLPSFNSTVFFRFPIDKNRQTMTAFFKSWPKIDVFPLQTEALRDYSDCHLLSLLIKTKLIWPIHSLTYYMYVNLNTVL